MKSTKTVFSCDVCHEELPDDYVSTDDEGHNYFVRNAYDEIPLAVPVKDCDAIVVHVRIGGKGDNATFNDLCDKCRLDLLRQAVEYLEQKVGGE